MVAEAGKPLATGTVWLARGNYTVAFTGATQSGGALQGLTYALGARERSDAIDPYAIDPLSPPSPPPPPPPDGGGGTDPLPPPVVKVTGPLSQPLTTIVDTITDPFLGL